MLEKVESEFFGKTIEAVTGTPHWYGTRYSCENAQARHGVDMNVLRNCFSFTTAVRMFIAVSHQNPTKRSRIRLLNRSLELN